MEDGTKPDFKAVALRTLCRFIPFEAFTYLGSSNPMGWHDKLSSTRVVSLAKSESPLVLQENVDAKPHKESARIRLPSIPFSHSQIAVVIILVGAVALLFSWFQLRPSIAKKECNTFALELVRESQSPNKDFYDLAYMTCLRKRGL